MENKKEVLGTAIVVVVLVLAGGGFWLSQRAAKPSVKYDGAASIESSGSNAVGGSSADSGGLSVTGSSGATSLGQLGNTSQSGLAGSGSQNGQGATAGGTSPVDPSTFEQYEKYKNNSTALFGDIKVGSGATLGPNQKAFISYKGWLTDGTLFDQSSSDASGQPQPFSFTLGAHQVISGLEEGVDGMKVGGSRLIIVPPALGYGAQGQGSIPPDAVLVFEVNLLDVQ